MLNRLRRHRVPIAAGALLVTATAISIGFATSNVAWGITAFLLISMIGGGGLLLLRELRRGSVRLRDYVRQSAHMARQVEEQAKHLDELTQRVMDVIPQVSAMATVVNRLEQPLSHGLALKSDLNGIRQFVDRAGRHDTAQIEAYLSLLRVAEPPVALPATRGWAASADYIALLVDTMLDRKPALIVDLGSGLTTVWLAMAAKANSLTTRIVAFDHDAAFGEQTNELLRRVGCSDIAEVRIAPLEALTGIAGASTDDADVLWYPLSAFADLEGIDMVSVDGPPQVGESHARQPALPVLESKLSASCIILLDDADRPDETASVEAWLQQFPGFARRNYALEKGAVTLTRSN